MGRLRRPMMPQSAPGTLSPARETKTPKSPGFARWWMRLGISPYAPNGRGLSLCVPPWPNSTGGTMNDATRLAIYCPKRTDDLRPEFLCLAGEPVEVTPAGEAEDNEYAGQQVYFVETPRRARWVPQCDLVFLPEGNETHG